MGSWGKAYRDNEGKGAEGQKKEKKPRFGEQDALLGVWRVGSGQGMESISTGGDEFWGDPGGGPQPDAGLAWALCPLHIRILNQDLEQILLQYHSKEGLSSLFQIFLFYDLFKQIATDCPNRQRC